MPRIKVTSKKVRSAKEEGQDEEHHIHVTEIVIGHRGVIALLGFSVGALFVSRSLWEYSADNFGLLVTALVGVLLFTVFGIYVGNIKDE